LGISGNWNRRISRRAFLGVGGMSVAALVLGSGEALAQTREGRVGYGPTVPDPRGKLDLPEGFEYRVISREGSRLSDGSPVPGDHDGMAAFQGPDDTTILVRNHELRSGDANPLEGRNPYDPAQPGGTTAIVVGAERRVTEDYVSSSGSVNNCAGGGTPWGTWLTCEEDRTTEGHGYVFEVDPREPENDLSKTPIREMGRFSHEAVDIDPRTGIAYLTEDDFEGLIDDEDPNLDTRRSYLYRFLPNNRRARPGALQQGGVLQVAKLDEAPADADFIDHGQRFTMRWITVNPETPRDDALAADATRFNRLEGAFFKGGAFWFDDTAGGENRLGQIYRYLPATNTIELYYEGTNRNRLESPDNIVVTPWGDLWVAEDGDWGNRIVGFTPEGRSYVFANNRVPSQSSPGVPSGEPGERSEFAGPTFSPDGSTFFVNIQSPGITYAIWGPFKEPSGARQRQMAHADPPKELRPRVSGELSEAAERYGMSELEAAAYDRLGSAVGLM
jgi:secreted PhoX family phosphatase